MRAVWRSGAGVQAAREAELRSTTEGGGECHFWAGGLSRSVVWNRAPHSHLKYRTRTPNNGRDRQYAHFAAFMQTGQ